MILYCILWLPYGVMNERMSIISLECYQCEHLKSNKKLSRSGIQQIVVNQVIDQLQDCKYYYYYYY